MDSTAIKPTFYQNFTAEIDKEAKVEVTDETQQALAYITRFKGWELGKAYAKRLEDYLESLVSEAMSQGMSMEEIGQRTMVKELAKFVLTSFINKFEDAKRHEDK